MAKKTGNKPEPEVEKTIETEEAAAEVKAVAVRVGREHIVTPHSIELRRNGGDHVVEARTEDHRHSETIGAKTIAVIIEEHGATGLLDQTDEIIEITFSPYTGEIISIQKFEEADEPAEEKTGDETEQTEEEKAE